MAKSRTSGAGLSANEKSIANKYNGQGRPGRVFDAYSITTSSGATVDVLWKKGDGDTTFLESYKNGKFYLERVHNKERYRQVVQQRGRKPKM